MYQATELFCKSFEENQKKQYYPNLNAKNVAGNKKFWTTVKHLPSDKPKSNEKFTSVEDDKIFTQGTKVAEELNLFLSNVLYNLKIPEFSETNPLAEEIANSILKPVLTYDKHASVTVIRNLRSHFQAFLSA